MWRKKVVQKSLSPDNYVQAPFNSQSYNRYAYCLNNPLRYIDPNGLWSIGLGFVFGYDSHGWHAGFGAALDVGFDDFGVNVNASHTWSTDGSNTSTANIGANVNFGIVGAGANIGYSVNSKSGSTFSAYLGANIVAVGAGVGYSKSWDASGRYIGEGVYAEAYVGIRGLASYGGGYQWGCGGYQTGWYQTASLFTNNWRNDGNGWNYQGFNYTMNLANYNSHNNNDDTYNNACLDTEHWSKEEDGWWISHSIIKGVYNGENFEISWGPTRPQSFLKFLFGGSESRNTYPQEGNYNSQLLSCVSISKLYQYSKFLDAASGILPYNALTSSCAGHAAAALYFAGMPYMGFHSFNLEYFVKNKF